MLAAARQLHGALAANCANDIPSSSTNSSVLRHTHIVSHALAGHGCLPVSQAAAVGKRRAGRCLATAALASSPAQGREFAPL
jgi:hypothetical protein